MAYFKVKSNKSAKKRHNDSAKAAGLSPYRYAGWAVLLIIASGLLVWGSYALFSKSSYFVVGDVAMEGAEAGSTVDYDALKKMLVGENIFKLNLKEIRNHMLTNYRELQNLRLTRTFPDSISAVITLRKPVAQIYQNRYYPVDAECVILSEVNDYPDDKLPIISGVFTNLSGRVGEEADTRRVKEALLLLKELNASGILDEYKLVEIDISNVRNAIFFLQDGLEVKIGHEDYRMRLKNLKDILQDPKVKPADIRYIDLRFREPVIGPKWKR